MIESNRFTDEQAQTLALSEYTYVRRVQSTVDMLDRNRKAPDEAWLRTEKLASSTLTRLAAIGGAGDVGREEIEGWLSAVRAMADGEFARVRRGLAAEWAEVLMPQIIQQLKTPESKKQRLQEVCRRLLTQAYGHALTRALIEESAAQEE